MGLFRNSNAKADENQIIEMPLSEPQKDHPIIGSNEGVGPTDQGNDSQLPLKLELVPLMELIGKMESIVELSRQEGAETDFLREEIEQLLKPLLQTSITLKAIAQSSDEKFYDLSETRIDERNNDA